MTSEKNTSPATLATAKHGGCVQLRDALHEAVGRIFGCDGSPWRTRDVAAVLRDYASLAVRQPVEAAPQGCDACDRTGIRQNDEGRNISCPDCDLGRACAGDTHQPVGQITDAEIDARLNALYREMVDSGQHNGGMSGVAWDRAVFRMASKQPVQAVDLGEVIEQIAEQWDGCSYDAVGETIDVGQAIRAAGERLINSQAVANG